MSFVGREELPYSCGDLAHGPSANDGQEAREKALSQRRSL